MISFLRFVGLINAAIWLGSSVFFLTTGGPTATSSAVQRLLGSANFPYFSGAFAQIGMRSYFNFLGALGLIALLHLLAEWFYMGRPARKISMALVGGLLLLLLTGGLWLAPRLQKLHARGYDSNISVTEREKARQSFNFLHAGFVVLNLVMIGGTGAHLWRIANPSDAPRFISSIKFRG